MNVSNFELYNNRSLTNFHKDQSCLVLKRSALIYFKCYSFIYFRDKFSKRQSCWWKCKPETNGDLYIWIFPMISNYFRILFCVQQTLIPIHCLMASCLALLVSTFIEYIPFFIFLLCKPFVYFPRQYSLQTLLSMKLQTNKKIKGIKPNIVLLTFLHFSQTNLSSINIDTDISKISPKYITN